MTFYLSIFSILNHIVQISSQFVLFVFNLSPSVGAWFIFLFAFIVAFKNFSNIFFFYYFNRQFRQCLLNFFKRNKIQRNISLNRNDVPAYRFPYR